MQDGRPNILFVLTDQQRYDAVGAQGASWLRTPALDDLCARGTRFSRAYTPCPVCVPARYATMTGRAPHRTGCTQNGAPVPRDVPTLMERLSAAGYRTHAVGKMHFRPTADPHGLQTMELSEGIPSSVEEDAFLAYLNEQGFDHVHEPHGVRGDMYYIPQVSQLPACHHVTAWTAARSMDFLHRHAGAGDGPFFLWTSFIKPHPPFDPPVPWNKLYDPLAMPGPLLPADVGAWQSWWMRHQNRYKYREDSLDRNLLRSMRAAYYASVSFIDYQLGRLVAVLEETGELERTLILFASDHGEFLGDYGSFGKRSFLEPSARIPLIAAWADGFAAGAVCHEPVSLLDIMPTFLAAAGVDRAGQGLDGRVLMDVAAGGARERVVIGQLGAEARGEYMAVTREHKYVYQAADRREWFFVREDGAEAVNRIHDTAQQAAVRRLRSTLLERLGSEGSTSAVQNGGWRPFPRPPDRPPDQDRIRQPARWTHPYPQFPGYTRQDPPSS